MSRNPSAPIPLDGVVLLMGCDKTTPSLLMGAASVDLPTIGVSGGPSLSGNWRGKPVGSGTGVIEMSEMVRAGTLSQAEFTEAEACMQRSRGSCMTMGTASTMASLVEALGMSLPENAAIPAVDSRRMRLAHLSGRRIVEMVREDLRMSKVLTARRLRQRHPRQRRHRWIDQRGDPSAGAGRSPGRAARRSRTGIASARTCPAWSISSLPGST